jgi:hypothetical protein
MPNFQVLLARYYYNKPRMKWAGHAAHMGEGLGWKTKRIHRLENNANGKIQTKMDLDETGCEVIEWMPLEQ